MADSYKIVKHLGSIGKNSKGYDIQLNLVSWFGKEPKYDLRGWLDSEEEGLTMSKGLILNVNNMKELKNLLDTLNL